MMMVKFSLSFLLLTATYDVVKATLNRPAGPVLQEQGIPAVDPALNVKVACYYYPWHFDDFHRDEKYLRDYLMPRQEPSLGEYDDRDPEVIKEHLRMSRQANCRVWIAAWFGIGSREDTTLLQHTFNVLEANDPDQRVAIHYETNALLRTKVADNQGLENIFFTLDGKPGRAGDGVADHMKHFCDNYFNKPNYYFVQGDRPVIFLYLTRVLDNERDGIDEDGNVFTWQVNELLEAVVDTMRETVMAECEMNPFIIGDHIFNQYVPSRDDFALSLLDAVNGYDVYGHLDDNSNGFAGEEVESFAAEQEQWKVAANEQNCAYIPSITPGFNDRAVRLRTKSDGSEAMSLSRRLTPGSLEGSFFAKSIELAIPLLDPGADFLMALTSFNEIHEDSQIEPMVVDRMARALVIAADGTQAEVEAQKTTRNASGIWNEARDGYLDPSEYQGPDEDLTQGLDYEAYYDLYLNILRATTLSPFYEEDFENDPIEGTLEYGAQVINGDLIESKSLELVKTDASNAPKFRIDLGSIEFNFLVIDFMFYSERSEANEFLIVRCLDQDGGLAQEISSEKWQFSREYQEHRKPFYAVSECNIKDVAPNHSVVIEILYEAFDDRTSMIIDSLKVTGLSESSNGTPLPCTSDEDCRDNFCDGEATCVNFECIAGPSPCSGDSPICIEESDEENARCVACSEDSNCGGGEVCNQNYDCVACVSNSDCDNTSFCSPQVCDENFSCVSGDDPCTGENLICIEESDKCVACVNDNDCDNTAFCSPQICDENFSCVSGDDPCTDGKICNESGKSCDVVGPPPVSETCKTFAVEIKLDNYPQDNGYVFEELSPDPQVISSVPVPSYSGQRGFVIQMSEEVCDGIYQFTFLDVYEFDGICCKYSIDGYLRYFLDDILIKEWKESDEHTFLEDVFPFTVGTEIFPRQDFESSTLGNVWKEDNTDVNANDSELVQYSSQSLPNFEFNKASIGGGQYCVRLRGTPTTGSAIFTGALNVAGFSKLSLEFDYYVDNFEDGDDFVVQWKAAGVAGFKLEESFQYKSNGSGIGLQEWRRATVELDEWVAQGRPGSIDLRIMSHASSDDDRVFIDNIMFYGMVQN